MFCYSFVCVLLSVHCSVCPFNVFVYLYVYVQVVHTFSSFAVHVDF